MKLFKITFLTVILIIGYFYKDSIVFRVNTFLYQSPCDTPLTYHVGNIDPKFNVGNVEFLKNIGDAVDIWDRAYGKKLFVFEPQGALTINLIYDDRQSLKGQINILDNQVLENQKILSPKIADYEKRAVEFERQIVELNQSIESWNKRGGAPPTEYQKIKSEQESLMAEADKLQAIAQTLNQSTAKYNTEVRSLDQTISAFNQVLQFKPEEGKYTYENGRQKIDIYFNVSRNELVHTLAHELGHSIGITHNDETTSIMYPQTSQSLTLSPADQTSLAKVCQKKSIIEIGEIKLQNLIRFLIKRFNLV